MRTDRARGLSAGHWLLLLLLLLAAVRGLAVLRLGDVFFYGEELEKGTVAKALLDRPGIPYYHLPFHHFEGGGFAIAHLTALAFLAVGQNLLAHKLVATLFSAAILVCAFLLGLRTFGKAAAVLSGLGVIFLSEGMQRLSLLNLGTHREASLFMLLIPLLAVRPLSDRAPPPARLAALGLACGFGTYFSYQVAPVVALVVCALALVQRRRLFGRPALAFAGGLIAGAAPLLFMISQVGARMLDVHGTQLFSTETAPEILSLSELAWSAVSGRTASVVPVAALLLVGGFAALRARKSLSREARSVLLLLASYLAVYFAILGSSSFGIIDLDASFFVLLRLAPPLTVASVLAGMAAAGLWSARRPALRIFAAACAGTWLATGALGTWSICRQGTARDLGQAWDLVTHTKGYDYHEYFVRIVDRLPRSPEERLAMLAGFDEPAPPLLYEALASAVLRDPALSRERAFAAARSLAPESWPGPAMGLARRAIGSRLNDPLAALAAVESWAVPAEEERVLFEGVGRRIGWRSRPLPKWIAETTRRAYSASTPVPPEFFRGLGRQVYYAFMLDPDGARRFLEASLPKVREPLRAGYELERELNRL